MLVILKENIEHLGHIGDLVKVTDGYARNFLIPRKLALVADKNNVAQIEHQKKVFEKKKAAQKASAEEAAKKLSEFSCTIARKVGAGDKLFGAITAHDISVVLKKGGFEIGKSSIMVESPIKTLGVHTVSVKLQPEVSASLKVWVVKEA